MNRSLLRHKLKKINEEMHPKGTETKINGFGDMVLMDLYLCLDHGTL